MRALLGGKVYKKQLGDWTISWESKDNYRHWCYQKHPENNEDIIVVMFNPGSLSSDGKKLTQDTTLRILREVFTDTGFSPFIVNLFDFASPQPDELFNNWDKRDSNLLIYSKLAKKQFCGIIYAYGDNENHPIFGHEIRNRINLVKRELSYLHEIILPKNINGSPKHPNAWQRQKLKNVIKSIITSFKVNK